MSGEDHRGVRAAYIRRDVPAFALEFCYKAKKNIIRLSLRRQLIEAARRMDGDENTVFPFNGYRAPKLAPVVFFTFEDPKIFVDFLAFIGFWRMKVAAGAESIVPICRTA